jgi:hypothetical protein
LLCIFSSFSVTLQGRVYAVCASFFLVMLYISHLPSRYTNITLVWSVGIVIQPDPAVTLLESDAFELYGCRSSNLWEMICCSH